MKKILLIILNLIISLAVGLVAGPLCLFLSDWIFSILPIDKSSAIAELLSLGLMCVLPFVYFLIVGAIKSNMKIIIVGISEIISIWATMYFGLIADGETAGLARTIATFISVVPAGLLLWGMSSSSGSGSNSKKNEKPFWEMSTITDEHGNKTLVNKYNWTDNYSTTTFTDENGEETTYSRHRW